MSVILSGPFASILGNLLVQENSCVTSCMVNYHNDGSGKCVPCNNGLCDKGKSLRSDSSLIVQNLLFFVLMSSSVVDRSSYDKLEIANFAIGYLAIS